MAKRNVRKSVIAGIHVDALEAIDHLHEVGVAIPAALRRIQENAKKELVRINHDT